MSYILEALRKSERARQNTQSPDLNAVIADAQPSGRAWVPWALVGILVVLNGIALGFFWLRDRHPPEAAPQSIPPPQLPKPTTVLPAPELQAPAKSVAVPALPAPEQEKPAPVVTRKPARDVAKPRVVLPNQDDQQFEIDRMPPPKPLETLKHAPVQPRVAEEGDGGHGYRINVLAYAPAPEERFAVINMTKYFKGDRLPDGAVVEAIEQDGVILSRKGERLRIAH